MKEGLSDIVVDKLKGRLAKVSLVLEKRFKNTKPFRKEPLTKRQQMAVYRSLTPEQIAMGLQAQTQFYTQRMNEILQQYPPEQHEAITQQLKTPEDLAEEDINEFIWENEDLIRSDEDARRLRGINA